jgi:hypothetical protein
MSRFAAGIQFLASMFIAALCVYFFDAPWWLPQLGSAGYLIVTGLWEQRK